jgi:UDP-N-acetylglucosamine 2-epimerase (non-hydrolysing)
VSGTPGKRRLLCVVGTRPEGIKMAPVILALQAEPWAQVRVLSTAQHRAMLDQVLGLFGIVPDIDLDVMQADQSLAALTARLIERIDAVLAAERPDLVLAQGDTTTVLTVALCCFYRNVPFGHVEAGLRTHVRRLPFPEEMNRTVASYLADLHFAPTEGARANLVREGIDAARIFVTGNTVIDALLQQVARGGACPVPLRAGAPMVLVTAHRRENFGEPLEQVCAAIAELAGRHPEVDFLLPVHPNPNVSRVMRARLGGQPGVHLCEPLDYAGFVAALERARFVITDSGGVQEEAPALGKPVLVMRSETERPEAVGAGVAALVGTEREAIVAAAGRLLSDPAHYAAMSQGGSPYGDGRAAARIVEALRRHLGVEAPTPASQAPQARRDG